MSVTQGNGVCPAILVGLDEIVKQQGIASLAEPVGFLESLFDPTNRQPRTVIQDVDGGKGHPKTVRITHKQRLVEDDVVDVKNCAAGDPIPRFEDTFQVDSYSGIKFAVEESTVRTLCDNYSQLMRLPGARVGDYRGGEKQLDLMAEAVYDAGLSFDALRTKINKNLLTAAAIKTGKWRGGANSKTYITYRQSTTTGAAAGQVIADGLNRMKQDLKRIGFNGQPIIVGEGTFDLTMMSGQYGCCNADGIEIGRMMQEVGLKYYRDLDAGTILGETDAVLAFFPGVFQLASYNENSGAFMAPIGVTERGVIPDPILGAKGLIYDLRVRPVECSGNDRSEHYEIEIGLNYDLYATPTNIFNTGDPLVGVNGSVRALIEAYV